MDSEAEVKAEANLPLTAKNEEATATTQSSDLDTSEQKHAEPIEQVEGDGLSKKGRKRLLKQEIRKDAKKIKKLRDREKKKGTNSRSFRLPPPPSEGAGGGAEAVTISRKERKESSKIEFAGLCVKNFTVIIDLNWEEHHTEKALKSLKQQVMYCYGFNKRHTHPALIHLTGLGPLLSEQLVAQNHADNWVGMKMSREEYSTLENYSISYDDDVKAGVKKQLVYLSSDAEETIDALDVNCAYIIGGIVDRNRLKGITHKKAVAQGIRTVKLPIKENFGLAATHILTVNHVFEILLNYGATGGWRQAMELVLPQRKHAKALGETGGTAGDEGEEAEEGVEGVGEVEEVDGAEEIEETGEEAEGGADDEATGGEGGEEEVEEEDRDIDIPPETAIIAPTAS